MQSVFDGHNDVLLRLWHHARDGADPIAEFRDGTSSGHIDAPRAKAGGLCAIYIPSGDLVFADPDSNGHYATPLAAPLERAPSLDIALDMAAIALRLDRAGAWKLCRSTTEIRDCMEKGIFAAVMHMEGCEAIDADLVALETFYAAGLRSLGPVWSRNNVFAHGVPFAYPSSPDTGPGLTEAGFALVRECNRLGILIDLAHITEKGFWDVAKTSDQPLVASHSNAHALTPVARNLTDKQLGAINESRGIVGLNYATAMLRHVDHLVGRVGIDCVGLGSDFDGATIPAEISDAAGNQKLIEALRNAGYGEADLVKLCRENWLRVLASAWKEDSRSPRPDIA